MSGNTMEGYSYQPAELLHESSMFVCGVCQMFVVLSFIECVSLLLDQ